MNRVSDIRAKLIQKYKNQEFVIDKTGVKTVELIGESFVVDEDWIIRPPNYEYIERELAWYVFNIERLRLIPLNLSLNILIIRWTNDPVFIDNK